MSTSIVTNPASGAEHMPSSSFLAGGSCSLCGTGVYRIVSAKAGSKRLSKFVGRVLVVVAIALITVGLIDLLGIGINGAFPLFFPGVTLGALAALMIQWGNSSVTGTNSDLLCDLCGMVPPDGVLAVESS